MATPPTPDSPLARWALILDRFSDCTDDQPFAVAAAEDGGTVRLTYGDARAMLRDLQTTRAALDRLRAERITSVVFGHHKDAPRPFALYRRSDVTGVSGTGIVAEGTAFSDGTAVLRWLSEWPTSVVFHDRGIEAIEQIHGHGGATQIVWLSDELEPLAAMEQERDALRAEVERLRGGKGCCAESACTGYAHTEACCDVGAVI